MTHDFYLVANWKMNFTPSEAQELYASFLNLPREQLYSGADRKVHLWVAAPSIVLPALQSVRSGQVRYGGQNVHFEETGAFTGEISVPMLRSCGAEFSLVGHSERRHIFGEDDELLFQRTQGALKQGFPIIFCVGETLEEREAGKTSDVLESQLKKVLPLFQEFAGILLVAYEPVWAIGTGKVATTEEVGKAHSDIKRFIDQSGAPQPPVLYGGSVKPDNIEGLAKLDEVDGALVGGASLDLMSFSALYSGVLKSL